MTVNCYAACFTLERATPICYFLGFIGSTAVVTLGHLNAYCSTYRTSRSRSILSDAIIMNPRTRSIMGRNLVHTRCRGPSGNSESVFPHVELASPLIRGKNPCFICASRHVYYGGNTLRSSTVKQVAFAPIHNMRTSRTHRGMIESTSAF